MRDLLRVRQAQSVAQILLVSAVFPFIESVLVSLWASGTAGSDIAWYVLLLVAFLHLIFSAFIVFEEVRANPLTTLPDAIEVEQSEIELQAELDRRDVTYDLVRRAFDLLNSETCRIEYDNSEQTWCKNGFANGLKPLLEPFADYSHQVFGTLQSQFTLEVYFEPGTVPEKAAAATPPNSSGLCLHFFHGKDADATAANTLNLGPCAPARSCIQSSQPFTKSVFDDAHIFMNGTDLKPEVYFLRYAVCPITETCDTDVIGAIVLTTRVDRDFTSDVLEVMAFIATLIAAYLSAYRRCFTAYSGESKL